MVKNLVATPGRRRVAWLVLAAGVAIVAVALPLFQPWKLWVDETVDEPPPAAVTAADPGATSAGPPPAAEPATIARGTFISHEHDTTGTVRVVRGSDGSRYLRIEDLDTSNGPALKVWLTDAPVLAGKDGWFVFDDGRYVDLGALKGNKGSQNYPIPAGVDLAGYRSVTIWCARFRVSFGAAQLTD
ncbi:DM13 domain-containing protein [Actinoplanes regularis]|uniref:DM13 domain-containing protein n=1 Tax=Actinoplanes regularis TaxID=52697 RepID=UPI0024A0DD19|nr:hypothetical protein Areg01_22070 [Actinoplanes regularis]